MVILYRSDNWNCIKRKENCFLAGEESIEADLVTH